MIDLLDLVRRFVAAQHPAAAVALLTGSHARGDAAPGSDVDVVLLFPSLPEGAWREMTLFEGRHLELFAHDLATLAYFCREVDRPSGIAALPMMIVEGVSALPRPSGLLAKAQEIARATLQGGPPPLSETALDARRFAITDLAAGMVDERSRSHLMAAGVALYAGLADFILRAAGKWSASGKAIPQALAVADADLARRFEEAFAALFTAGRTALLQALIDRALAPYGGPLRDGFRQTAPANWRD